jgi:hypothetical protein
MIEEYWKKNRNSTGDLILKELPSMLKDSFTCHNVVSRFFDFIFYISPVSPVGQVPCWRISTHFPSNISISVLMLKSLCSWVFYTARFQTLLNLTLSLQYLLANKQVTLAVTF